LPALEGLPVYRAFSERLNLKYGVTSPHRPWTLVLDNDGTCAAAGELAFGAAKNYQDAIVLTLGTGIGSGIIVAGQILRGARGFAGEPGHMVIDPAGPPCQCGRTGCFEKLASGSALTRLARTAAARGEATRILELADGDAEAVRGEYVLKAAREGDPDAFKIYRELATSLAAGIANLVEILDPAVVIIGGGLADAGTILLDATVEAFAASGDRRGIGPTAVPIKLAELGYRAGAFGAAAQALGIVH
jgi:glucokinase